MPKARKWWEDPFWIKRIKPKGSNPKKGIPTRAKPTPEETARRRAIAQQGAKPEPPEQ